MSRNSRSVSPRSKRRSAAPQLGHLPEGSKSGKRKRGLLPAHEREREPLRRSTDQLAHEHPDVRNVVHQVVVVDDERGAALAEALELTHERRDDCVARRSGRDAKLGQEALRCRGEVGLDLTARRDEVVEEAHPVAVLLVEAVPHRRTTVMAGEVGEEGRLAIARFGDHEHDPVMDLDLQPVEQPLPTQDFPPERRSLDLRRLERELVHDLAADRKRHGRGRRRSSRTDRHRFPRADAAAAPRGRSERYGSRSGGVNGAIREEGLVGQGHGGHGARERSPDD